VISRSLGGTGSNTGLLGLLVKLLAGHSFPGLIGGAGGGKKALAWCSLGFTAWWV